MWRYRFCRVSAHHQDLDYSGYLGSPKTSRLPVNHLRSPFMSACQISRHQPISPNHRLFRLAKISRHLSHIIKHLTVVIPIGFNDYQNSSIIRACRVSWHHYLGAQSRKISNLTECCALRNISTRQLTSAHESRVFSLCPSRLYVGPALAADI